MLEKRMESGYSCKVGSKYCGGVSFADDLFLLMPTLVALQNIVNICELFAIQFNITFNGCKNKVLVFEMKGVESMSEIYVKGELVPRINDIVYLEHVIKNDRSDTLAEGVVRGFNSKSIMADFGCTSSVVKHKIFQ